MRAARPIPALFLASAAAALLLSAASARGDSGGGGHDREHGGGGSSNSGGGGKRGARSHSGGGGGREHEGGSWRRVGGGHQRAGYSPGAPVVIKMRRYHVPPSSPIKDPSRIVQDQRRIAFPEKDAEGSPIRQRPETAPPRRHGEALRGGELIRDVEKRRAKESVPGRYYWHETRKVKYCHYLDDHGLHWYGFYHGPTFYWTRYHGGRWWWYDQGFQRWSYWYSGFWWWQAPGGVEYVYVDNNYYPYEAGVVTTKKPEVQAPPAEALAVYSSTQPPAALSPDGKRSVVISGPDDEAYLFDESATPPAMLKYLGPGVSKARFSEGPSGKAPRILLDFKDGSFALFDADGSPLDAPPTIPLEEEPPGPAPDFLLPEPPPQRQ